VIMSTKTSSATADHKGYLGDDMHSYANFKEIVARDYSLKLRADFRRKIFHGHVDIRAEVLVAGVRVLKLDTNALAIESVHLLEGKNLTEGESLDYTQPVCHHKLGTALHVPLPAAATQRAGESVHVRIYYSTTPRSAGVQWLKADQTGGKRHPFVFTQGEAILARSLLPCQDTPAVKAPYSLRITVPSPLVAVASGVQVGEVEFEEDGELSYTYRSAQPIPAYLIAIGIGQLAKARIGTRSHVWAERYHIDACRHEFEADTDAYIAAAEKICGVKYDWGTYDILVLPGSFPYGGMENPNLTFLNTSIVAGDRSLTNVVAHEITHSWAGNYVTNARWDQFWLNEGFTVYIERLILGQVAQSEAVRHFEMMIGYNDLVRTVADIGPTHSFSSLTPELISMDPDDAFSKIPYEKGSLFLFYLELVVGGKDAMMAWLGTYFTRFRARSVTVEEMKEHFLGFFRAGTHAVEQKKMDAIDWNTWLLAPGMPAFNPMPHLDRSLATACDALAAKWLSKESAATGLTDAKTQDFTQTLRNTKQRVFFLDALLSHVEAHGAFSTAFLNRLNDVYRLAECRNAEILVRWFLLCIKSSYRAVLPSVSDFLSCNGRGLYVKPLYKALKALDLAVANQIYNRHRSFYHTVIRQAIEPMLAPPHPA